MQLGHRADIVCWPDTTIKGVAQYDQHRGGEGNDDASDQYEGHRDDIDARNKKKDITTRLGQP